MENMLESHPSSTIVLFGHKFGRISYNSDLRVSGRGRNLEVTPSSCPLFRDVDRLRFA
jgi:hypothetical protein